MRTTLVRHNIYDMTSSVSMRGEFAHFAASNFFVWFPSDKCGSWQEGFDPFGGRPLSTSIAGQRVITPHLVTNPSRIL